jgi:hypothetical protein
MYRLAYQIGIWVKAWRLGYRDGYDAKARACSNDDIEAAYWLFDHKKTGSAPMSERDAFKWSVRQMLAGTASRRGVL